MFEPVFVLSLPPMNYLPAVALGMKTAGVRRIEVGGWGRYLDYSDLELMTQARGILEANDVEVYSYHPPFGGDYDFSAIDEGAHARAVERNIRQLHVAAALGAKYAVIHPSDGLGSTNRLFRRRNAGRGLRTLTRVAEETGVALAIENLPPGYLAADVEELMWLVDGCESERAGVCFDTGHAHVNGARQSEFLSRIGNKLFTIHWHDNDGSRDQHQLPGLGTIDWPDFFAGLRQLGWQRPICLEVGLPVDQPLTAFVSSVREALAKESPVVT
ncbi:MAG: sugar phosphate isomerase/epimerase [Armatimonadetes bacterium]|nr:sugar phosphate isomerase/epimerase [Armatimonadota bacterium]